MEVSGTRHVGADSVFDDAFVMRRGNKTGGKDAAVAFMDGRSCWMGKVKITGGRSYWSANDGVEFIKGK